jgi:hypothetical protein
VWTVSKVNKLARFLDLRAKQVYKWKYDRSNMFWRMRDKCANNDKIQKPLFHTVERKRVNEECDDIVLFKVIKG